MRKAKQEGANIAGKMDRAGRQITCPYLNHHKEWLRSFTFCVKEWRQEYNLFRAAVSNLLSI